MKPRYQVIVIDNRNYWVMYHSVEGGLNHNPLYAETFEDPKEAEAVASHYVSSFRVAMPIKIS